MTEPSPGGRRRYAVVANPRAGALLGAQGMLDRLRDILAEGGIEARFVPEEAGDLPARVRAALADGPDAVVVAGGDGTVACAACALAGTETPLGIIPMGTMNLLARDLGIPVGDPEAAARALAEGHARAIDVGEVGGQVFLCAAMIGTPAWIGRHRETARGRGALGRALHLGRAFFHAATRHRAMVLRLQWGGKTRRLRSPSFTVTVNALGDVTGRTFGRADLAGGELAAYAVRPISVLSGLRLVGHLIIGRWPRSRALDVIRTPAITVETGGFQAVHAMLDGEQALLPPPLVYRVRPGALRVIAPGRP